MAAGHRVLARRYRCQAGEIDLVCEAGGRLIMVEVKTRSSNRFGAPVEAAGGEPIRRLTAAGAEFRRLAGWRGPVEFVVASVEMADPIRPDRAKVTMIRVG